MKYMKEIRRRFSSRPVFTISDVRLFLSESGATRGYPYLVVSYLLKRKEIRKLKKGVYTFHDDPTLASFAFSPSYHGLQDALSLLGLWDQETNTVLITPLKVRAGKRTILESPVFIRRINRRMFFGFSAMKYFEYWVQVSDVEKTLIDFAYFGEPLQPQVAREIKKRIDRKKLQDYFERCPAWVKKKAMEFLKPE